MTQLKNLENYLPYQKVREHLNYDKRQNSNASPIRFTNMVGFIETPQDILKYHSFKIHTEFLFKPYKGGNTTYFFPRDFPDKTFEVLPSKELLNSLLFLDNKDINLLVYQLLFQPFVERNSERYFNELKKETQIRDFFLHYSLCSLETYFNTEEKKLAYGIITGDQEYFKTLNLYLSKAENEILNVLNNSITGTFSDSEMGQIFALFDTLNLLFSIGYCMEKDFKNPGLNLEKLQMLDYFFNDTGVPLNPHAQRISFLRQYCQNAIGYWKNYSDPNFELKSRKPPEEMIKGLILMLKKIDKFLINIYWG